MKMPLFITVLGIIGICFLSIGVVSAVKGCSSKSRETTDAGQPSAVEPSASAPVVVPVAPPALEPSALPVGDPVVLLDLPTVTTTYGSGEQKAVLGVGPSGMPYPYRLMVEGGSDPAADCGFFSSIQKDGWRVAFCLDASGKRVPKKLYLWSLGDRVGFEIESTNYGFFDVEEGG